MDYSRDYNLSSGSSLPDAVHKQILVRSCGAGQYEVLIYEGDCLPGVDLSNGVHVVQRHADEISAHRQADREYVRSLAIGWLLSGEVEF